MKKRKKMMMNIMIINQKINIIKETIIVVSNVVEKVITHLIAMQQNILMDIL
jgi:hypothetical protein